MTPFTNIKWRNTLQTCVLLPMLFSRVLSAIFCILSDNIRPFNY